MSSFFPGFGTSSAGGGGILILNYTAVNNAMSPYTTISTDSFIGADTATGAITILLPNAPATGRVYIVKDVGGIADINNITISTVGGSVDIDGFTTSVMNTEFQAVQLLFNGTEYLLF